MGDLVPLDNLGQSTFHVCDRCGHQAFAAARRAGHTTLLFCGHHLAQHYDMLVQDGWEIEDRRNLINEKASVSANAG